MGNEHVIRAWKVRRYRDQLSSVQRSRLPENPAGGVELEDRALERIGGALADGYLTQHGCLTMATYACGSCGITIRAL